MSLFNPLVPEFAPNGLIEFCVLKITSEQEVNVKKTGLVAPWQPPRKKTVSEANRRAAECTPGQGGVVTRYKTIGPLSARFPVKVSSGTTILWL